MFVAQSFAQFGGKRNAALKINRQGGVEAGPRRRVSWSRPGSLLAHRHGSGQLIAGALPMAAGHAGQTAHGLAGAITAAAAASTANSMAARQPTRSGGNQLPPEGSEQELRGLLD